MWTEITRRKYERAVPRYASDLSDAEWALIEPFMPVRKLLGSPRETDLRAVLDAILYIARSGCQWRMLRKTFRPSRACSTQSVFYNTLKSLNSFPVSLLVLRWGRQSSAQRLRLVRESTHRCRHA